MELKAEAPATQWIGPVDPYPSEKVIHNRKGKRVRYKDKAKWPHIFFPCSLVAKLNNGVIICHSSFQQ